MLRISGKNLVDQKNPRHLSAEVSWRAQFADYAQNMPPSSTEFSLVCVMTAMVFHVLEEGRESRTLSLPAVCSDCKTGLRLQHWWLPCQPHCFCNLEAPRWNSEGAASYPLAWGTTCWKGTELSAFTLLKRTELDSKLEPEIPLFNMSHFSLLGLALLVGKLWCFDLV